MTHDEIITCPKSGGDLCYKVEVTKDVTNYFSMSCGFWTNSLMKEGEAFFEEQWEILPELYKDIAWTDPNTNLIWLPNTINIQDKGMVFAEGKTKEDWNWVAIKVKEVTENDSEKFKGQKYKPDVENKEYFPERNFLDALSYIGVIPE